ncbi:MAG: FAD-dependent oxidoreductase [Patescibacteria group bacterium]|nr:FAD-dependent oxidoreductase [Patescibacteria group bacterium]
MINKKSVVILGAGFGGIAAALKLGKMMKRSGLSKKYNIFLINERSYHTFYPLLYEVATTSKETAALLALEDIVNYKIEDIFNGLPVVFVQGKASEIDFKNKTIISTDGIIPFDHLIFALGAETNFFNIPNMEETAITLKSFKDAVQIRDAIWNLAMEGNEKINIIIGGGGSSGVELAGELREWSDELKDSFRNVELKVKIIEAAPTILPGFHSKVIYLAKQRLLRLGVEIINGQPIKEVGDNKIKLANGSAVPFDVLIWTGGTKAPSLINDMPFKKDKKGRMEVDGTLECQPAASDLAVLPSIYVIGDSACFYSPKTGNPIPAVARVAIEQGKIAAYNIFEDIKAEEKNKDTIRHFTYKPIDYPTITPVGGKFIIARIGPFVFKGLKAWIFKGLIEFNYLISIMPFWKAVQIWLYGLYIFGKNDRLG